MMLQKENVYAIPILHYKMEFASQVFRLFQEIKPNCVAVELPERHSELLLQAAKRLPDISVVAMDESYFLCEPCDGAFEGLKCAVDHGIEAFCIDLEVKGYPDFLEPFPDTHAIHSIGFQRYYDLYKRHPYPEHLLDTKRELHMARRLKELSLQYDKVLFIGGFHHVERILDGIKRNSFPKEGDVPESNGTLCTLTEEATRDCLAEYGWISKNYVEKKELLDRWNLTYSLLKSQKGHPFQIKTTLKFARNLSLLKSALTPGLYELITAAKGCIDDSLAYDLWMTATDYPYRKNDDNLPELDLSIEELWGASKKLHFKFKEKRRKGLEA